METPNYILKMDEAVATELPGQGYKKWLKIAVWAAIALILIASFCFEDSIFAEIRTRTKVILVCAAIALVFIGPKRKFMPSPVELQFFDDHLLIYRPRRAYGKKSRREYNVMPYAAMKDCTYDSGMQMLYFHGDVKATWYNFRKDGALNAVPDYARLVKETVQYICTRCTDVDFISEINAHCPVKVTVTQ